MLLMDSGQKGRCPKEVVLTTGFVCFAPAAALEHVLHVSIRAAFLENGFAFSLDFIARDLKTVSIFEFSNTCVTALLLH